MTQAEIDAKVTELSGSLGKVTPITLDVEGENVTGFFKEISYDVILFCTDCVQNKEISRGAEAVIRQSLIEEASDNRISDKEGNPAIAASFALAAMRLMKIYKTAEDIKKN